MAQDLQNEPESQLFAYPEAPSTQSLRLLGSKNHTPRVFGTRDLKYWVLGPFGILLESG